MFSILGDFSSLSGLLMSGNTSISQALKLPVSINPLAPYLHLPRSTCDAIASHLPVTYQAKYGLYFWNTNDPQYQKIVSSPSCLTFTFTRNSSPQSNLTINVPFQLLNLTLTAPLTSSPVQYFPCKAEQNTHYQLGRSFLQAAFVGVNWNAQDGGAAWFLAQAPGPGKPTQQALQVIQNLDKSIEPSAADWAASWNGYWTPLPADKVTAPSTAGSNPSTSSAASSSSGISSGAKAGIGAGVAIGAIGAVIGAAFFIWRRRKTSGSATSEKPASGPPTAILAPESFSAGG
jgi:hypothetical protein